MAIDPKNQRNIDETSVYIQDTLLSISANIGEALRTAVEDAFDGADASVVKSVGNDLSRSFRSLAKFSDDVASNSGKIAKGLLTSKDVTKQLQQLEFKRAALARKIMLARRTGAEINLEDFQATKKALDEQEKELKKDEARTAKIEENMGGLGEILTRLSKNKFFGSLLNAEEGLITMRAEAAKGTKGFALMGKGISAAFKGIEKASVILFAINAVVKAARFLVDLFIQADKQTISIARNLGISRSAADDMRNQFTSLQALTGKTRNNITALTKALGGVKGEFGIALNIANSFGDSMTFLTERLKVSEGTAAKFSMLFSSFGQNVTAARYQINEFVKEFAKVNAYAIPLDVIVNDIAEAGEGMAAQYGFSAEALGNAALQARKFGLSLASTKSVQESMLDFESSLNGEIKLGLYLGRRVNLAKARALALDGKSAEATAEVFKQLQGINKEQMQSPIFQKFAAEATGLTVDQLNRGFLLTQKTTEALKYQNAELKRIYETEGKEEAEKYRRQYNLSQLTDTEIEDIENRITATEKLSEAIDAIKSTFSSLMGTGTIDRFISALDIFSNFVLKLAGYTDKEILKQRLDFTEKTYGKN